MFSVEFISNRVDSPSPNASRHSQQRPTLIDDLDTVAADTGPSVINERSDGEDDVGFVTMVNNNEAIVLGERLGLIYCSVLAWIGGRPADDAETLSECLFEV